MLILFILKAIKKFKRVLLLGFIAIISKTAIP